MNKKALILTVGTGDIENPEKSLLAPLQKSIKKGEWDKIILLPSQITKKTAERLRELLNTELLEVSPLRAGVEDDADTCFAHFDEVLNGLLAHGYESRNILADFTRGTKAMSAALVLAAVRHEIPTLRYITGKRDTRGQVMGGHEVIKEIKTTAATARQKLDAALHFISRGAFAAALELLPDPENLFIKAAWPEEMLRQLAAVRSMAEFYSLWDRFNYKSAFHIAKRKFSAWTDAKKDYPKWINYFPNKEMRKWTQDLAVNFESHGYKEKPRTLRKIAADLLANAERRVRDEQYEDGVIRAYRIRELIAQIRLFAYGINTDDIPEYLPALAQAREKLEKSGRPWNPGEGKRFQAGREKAAMLLIELGDVEIGKKLLDENRAGSLSTKQRNFNLLIHGFRSLREVKKKTLLSDFRKMEDLIRADDPENAEKHLKVARSINFGIFAPST